MKKVSAFFLSYYVEAFDKMAREWFYSKRVELFLRFLFAILIFYLTRGGGVYPPNNLSTGR